MRRITTQEVEGMSIRELYELVLDSSRFHRIKHTDSFLVLVRRLKQQSKRIAELEKAIEEIIKVQKNTFRSDYGNWNEMLRIAKATLTDPEQED